MIRSTTVKALALLALLLVPAEAAAETNPWSDAKEPAQGEAESIGYYSAGCVRGAARLPAKGEGYEVMRPARGRDFGHPALVDYIQGLADRMKKAKIGPVMVGDLGQPMGGPSPHGHASHQSGLDVDIWFWHPPEAKKRRLSYKERQNISAHRVVDVKKKIFTRYWNDGVARFIKLATEDERVSRVLVNPLIKKRLCEEETGDRGYLRKIRPWYGHADHMHVRLLCPEGSDKCQGQKELPPGDGCEGLDWWFDEKAQAARKKGKKAYQKKVGALPELPEACQALHEDAP